MFGETLIISIVGKVHRPSGQAIYYRWRSDLEHSHSKPHCPVVTKRWRGHLQVALTRDWAVEEWSTRPYRPIADTCNDQKRHYVFQGENIQIYSLVDLCYCHVSAMLVMTAQLHWCILMKSYFASFFFSLKCYAQSAWSKTNTKSLNHWVTQSLRKKLFEDRIWPFSTLLELGPFFSRKGTNIM